MKNKQVLLGMTLILNTVSLTIFAGEDKKNNFLSEMIATSPIKTLMGGYLFTKDFVHWQLGVHAPYVVVVNTKSVFLFPSMRKNSFLKELGPKSWIGIDRFVRYRHLAGCLLTFAALETISK